MFDQLPLLESDISKETMTNIAHNAGYVCRLSLSEDEDETHHYYEKYWKFTNSLNPLLPSAAYMRRSAKNLDFNLRRDHQKTTYERRDYESVDEKSLS